MALVRLIVPVSLINYKKEKQNDKLSKHPKWLHYAIIVALFHLVGVTLLFINARSYPQMIGFGFLAYTLGLRHAFDADHIAAIDNTVRKLVQQKEDPSGRALQKSS